MTFKNMTAITCLITGLYAPLIQPIDKKPKETAQCVTDFLDNNGNTPLHNACFDVHEMSNAINCFKEIGIFTEMAQTQNNDGETVLHRLSMFCGETNTNIARTFISALKDDTQTLRKILLMPNKTGEDHTAFHESLRIASMQKKPNLSLVKLLIKGAIHANCLSEMLDSAYVDHDVPEIWQFLESAALEVDSCEKIEKIKNNKSEKTPPLKQTKISDCATIEDLIQAALAPSKGDNTAAGRALQKHKGRDKTSFFAEENNDADKCTERAISYVYKILTSPDSTFTHHYKDAFGEILDVRLPNGMGARWSGDGKTFIGFLEKKCVKTI